MTMSEPFSVLMSVYEKENPQYLDMSLDSVFSQTLFPSEVVICEDGKLTNELEVVIEKYKKRYPSITRVIEYPVNRGLGATLHDGVIECKNEIVFRMDADDISEKDRFERQMNIFINKDVDVVGTNICEYDELMSDKRGIRAVPEKHEDIVNYARLRNPINHMSVAFKKSSVVSAGNYKDMQYFEDYYLWIRMIINGSNFYNLQENLVRVRGGENMIKRRGGRKYLKAVRRFEHEILKLKFIGRVNYLKNIITRYTVSLVPDKARMLVYSKILRKKEI